MEAPSPALTNMRWGRRIRLALFLTLVGVGYITFPAVNRQQADKPTLASIRGSRVAVPRGTVFFGGQSGGAADVPAAGAPAAAAICAVARVVHQTWKDKQVQKAFEPRIASWVKLNPEWEYRFWTDKDNRELIATEVSCHQIEQQLGA